MVVADSTNHTAEYEARVSGGAHNPEGMSFARSTPGNLYITVGSGFFPQLGPSGYFRIRLRA